MEVKPSAPYLGPLKHIPHFPTRPKKFGAYSDFFEALWDIRVIFLDF